MEARIYLWDYAAAGLLLDTSNLFNCTIGLLHLTLTLLRLRLGLLDLSLRFVFYCERFAFYSFLIKKRSTLFVYASCSR